MTKKQCNGFNHTEQMMTWQQFQHFVNLRLKANSQCQASYVQYAIDKSRYITMYKIVFRQRLKFNLQTSNGLNLQTFGVVHMKPFITVNRSS